jgi:hypothetical protein
MTRDSFCFWVLAILPGLLHPFLLAIYFLRFRERKNLITLLLNRSVQQVSAVSPRHNERVKQQEEWQGRLDLDIPSYALPVAIASVLSIGASIVMLLMRVKPNENHYVPNFVFAFAQLATPAAVAGFAGAYIWGLYDFVDRFRILSMPTHALHMIWFRLLLGPVMGGYAQQLMAKDFAPVLVFALASVPVQSILKWMQDTASQRFAIGGQGPVVPPKWELVQGLTPDILARLNEVGVTSVAHLGNQDPVSLLRRTNIEWRNILDMMDQAYLASYIIEGIEKLRSSGIRGSIEMAVLWQRLESKDPIEQADAQAVVKAVAGALQIGEPEVRNLARNLWEDPQVDRIWSLWWNREDSEHRGPGPDNRTQSGERDPSLASRAASIGG